MVIRFNRHIVGAAAVIVAASATLFLTTLPGNTSPTSVPSATATPAHLPTPSPTPTACASSWVVTDTGTGGVYWLNKGVPSIKAAETNKEAAKAADDWLNGVRQNTYSLAGAASFVLNKTVDPSTLVENGCATGNAIALLTELKLAFAGADITPSTAPSNGYNSQRVASSGIVVGGTKALVTGNAASRKAVQITLPDGSTIWIMARCGNVVTTGPHTPPPPAPPPIVVCTQPGEHPDSSGNCSKGTNHATVPGTPVDPGDPLQTSTPTPGTNVSGSIDTSGKTGSNGKTDTQDQGGQASGANTSSTNSGTTDSNQSSNNGGTSTSDTGSGNTNTGDPGLPS